MNPQDELLYSLVHQLTADYRSSLLSIGRKHFKLQTFQNRVLELDPALTNESIDDLIESIEPTDFSSKRLRLELANSFKRPLIILEYIEKEEKQLVKRALQFSWLYQAGNSPFTNPKTLVRIILPRLSFSARLKIISGLSRNLKDEKLCEDIFKLVQEKYGSFSALDLLPSCTKEFIQQSLRCNGFLRINLNGQQALRIARKDCAIAVEFLAFILKYLTSTECNSISYRNTIESADQKHRMAEEKLCNRLRKILNYICPHVCENHPHGFLRLYEKYPDLIILERKPKTTKVLLAACKPMIISKASKFELILSPRTVFPCLEWNEYVDFVSSLLPDEIELFNAKHKDILEWLNPLPYQKRWKALSQAFLKKYETEILSFPDNISPLILKLIPQDTRNKVAAEKLKSNDPGRINFTSWEQLPKHRQGFWYSFMSLEQSIPKIKECLQNESDETVRAELLTYLVKTCKLNGRNKEAMLDVCRFVLLKYRNDAQEVRKGFLMELDQEFKLDKWMDADVWDTLMEFIKLAEAYKEPEPIFLSVAAIRYHILKCLPFEPLLNRFVKTLVSSCYFVENWNWFNDAPDLEEKFLKLVIPQLSKVYPEEVQNIFSTDSKLLNVFVTFVISIGSWKRRNRTISSRFVLQDYPWLIARILEIPTAGVERVHEKIHFQILTAIRSDTNLFNSYLEICIKKHPCAPVLEAYLHKDPTSILTNLLESIIPFIVTLEERYIKSYRKFFIHLKEFPEIASSIVETCLEVAQDDSEDKDKRLNSLIILSYLWDFRNYLNIISLFYPTKPTVDFTDEGFETQFPVKKAIIQSLTNTSFPSECLDPLGKFCIGDYTKISVGTLFSSCIHAPQNAAIKFLRDVLLDRPVSVKKLAIKLLCMISDYDELEELLTYLCENETHPTIIEVIISRLITFIIQNPSEKSWSLVKASMLSLTVKDKNAIQELFLPHHIAGQSTDNLVDYLKTCKQVITQDFNISSLDKSDFRLCLLQHLISAVTRHIILFPNDFLESLIHEYLLELEFDEQIAMPVVALTVLYLFSPCPCESLELSFPEKKLQLISGKMVKLKSQWNQTTTVIVEATTDELNFEKPVQTYLARTALHYFVTEVCKHAIRRAQKNPTYPTSSSIFRRICSTLLETVDSQFSRSETFAERLYLNFLIIFLDHMYTVEDGHAAMEQSLLKAGSKLRALTDLTIAQYHPVILSLYFEKMGSFFKDIYFMNLLNDNLIIFLLLGIVAEVELGPVSIENQVLVCKLLPDSPPWTPRIKLKYYELLGFISKFSSNSSKAYLGNKIVQTDDL